MAKVRVIKGTAGNLQYMQRHEYVNPWLVHTKTCSSCRGALRRAKQLRKWSIIFGLYGALGASNLRRPVASILAAVVGLILSSVGNKIVIELEDTPNSSDVSDRSIPLLD